MTQQHSRLGLAFAVVGAVACLVIAVAIGWMGETMFFTPSRAIPPPIAAKIEIPQDKTGCEAMGGKWGRIGIALQEQCNLPTADAGRVCADSSECQGLCIAELSKYDYDRVRYTKVVIPMQGKCAPWRITVGCVPVVRGGQVKEILCID